MITVFFLFVYVYVYVCMGVCMQGEGMFLSVQLHRNLLTGNWLAPYDSEY